LISSMIFFFIRYVVFEKKKNNDIDNWTHNQTNENE